MFDKIMRGIISLLGLLIGYGLAVGLKSMEIIHLSDKGWLGLIFYSCISIIFGIIFFLLAPKFIKGGRKVASFIETELQNVPAYEIALGL